MCSRYSFNITQQLIESNIFRIIDGFIPSQEDQKRQHYSADHFPFIIDSINLLDHIFPDKVESQAELEKHKAKLESDKRAYL